MEKKKPKIGLALGSGGAKGLAHIGVIKALQEEGIQIDYIAGSSIGAMVGGFYASGISVDRMEEIVLETNWQRIFSLVDPRIRQGFLSGEKVKLFIKKYLGDKKIEDCQIPFCAVATDLKTGETVILKKGEIAQAIRASISIPLVFKPVEMENRILADGGLSAPVPAEEVRKMGAEIVIAVNLDRGFYDEKWKVGWYDIANSSLSILRHHLALSDVKNSDIFINIQTGKNYWYDFVNGKDKISAGKKAVKDILPKLESLIKEKSN